ncbi:uncharacterized protein [Amphiura filiformis]|uniref:uncharacterized protein n=1 Tax=Amphiura filiformis TaxID=82378 RepID=UPI003B222A80
MADTKYDRVQEEPGLHNEEANETETQPLANDNGDEDTQLQANGNGDEETDTQPQAKGNGEEAEDRHPHQSGANGNGDEDPAELKTDTKEKQGEAHTSSNYTRMPSDTDVKKNPSTFMVLSILSCIFFPVFIGLNIFLSYLVIHYTRKGDVKEAKRASRAALQLNGIGIMMGILVYTAILGYFYYIN